jgi:glycosyltransferase involved in cell wall biosynthesis
MRIVNLHHGALIPSFRRLGHEVLHIGTTPDCDVVLAEPLSHRRFLDLLTAAGWQPDLVLWCDSCQPLWVFGLESLPAVVLGYSVDQYLNPWHVPYSAAFDTIFVAQKGYLPLFDQAHFVRPALWLPLYCDPDRGGPPDGVRDIPVSFVGTIESRANPGRKAFLEAFRERMPLYSTSGDYGPIFGRSRLVLNQSAAGELNFRVFEAMACGAALLTEATGNGLGELFCPGRDLLVYRRGDAADAADVARQALADPALPALAENGRRQTVTVHSALHRARTILATARRLAAAGAPRLRLARLAAVRLEVAKSYAFLGADTELPLPPEQRRFYLDLAARTNRLIFSSP